MNAVCLVVDRWHAGRLGCYGNSWVHTPHLDRLAAEGLLFDQALCGCPDLAREYASLWSGRHAFELLPGSSTDVDLPRRLAAHGVRSTLLTDDDDVASLPAAVDCEEIVRVPCQAAGEAAALEATNFARFFAAACDWLTTAQQPYCLWLHSRGLGGAWDAPRAFREAYAEPDERPPPEFTEPPRFLLPAGYDPDELWGIAQAHAGQVALLDECLGGLLEVLSDHTSAAETLIAALSPRGYPLGEHRRVGAVDEALYAETVHVPLVLRFPDLRAAGVRTQALVQPCDLYPTLLEWFGCEAPPRAWSKSLWPLVDDDRARLRQRSVVVSANQGRAIRTPAWYLWQPGPADASEPGDGPPAARLFAKPDDRFEVNDVADRCPEVVELLEQALAEAVAGGDAREAPLAEVLLSGFD